MVVASLAVPHPLRRGAETSTADVSMSSLSLRLRAAEFMTISYPRVAPAPTKPALVFARGGFCPSRSLGTVNGALAELQASLLELLPC
jgi:hypothetical protein